MAIVSLCSGKKSQTGCLLCCTVYLISKAGLNGGLWFGSVSHGLAHLLASLFIFLISLFATDVVTGCCQGLVGGILGFLLTRRVPFGVRRLDFFPPSFSFHAQVLLSMMQSANTVHPDVLYPFKHLCIHPFLFPSLLYHFFPLFSLSICFCLIWISFYSPSGSLSSRLLVTHTFYFLISTL